MRTLAVLVLLLAPATAPAADLSVGFGEADVTPELGKKPVYLAGFGQDRKAKSIHDPIMARAVVLSDGNDKIAVVSVDVVGLFLPTVEKVRAGLPGFKYVLVTSTHNHEGPDTLGLWGPTPFQSGIDGAYLDKLVAGCVMAVKDADAARKPAVASIGTATAPELLKDNRLPVVLHDELVAVRFADPKTGAPLGVMVQWNCHPEVLDSKNTAVTADFVGYTVKHLRASQKCPVVYLTGTVGGLMTTLGLPVKDEAGIDLKDGTFEKADRYGTLVGKLADQALEKATPLTLTPFDVRTRAALVRVDNNLYRLGWQFGTLSRTMYEWPGTPTPDAFTETKELSKPIAVKTEVGYLNLGELEVAVIPGEIYPELVLGQVVEKAKAGADFPDAAAEPPVYAQLKGKHRMIVGLGNDELGYFVPKRQWDEKPPFAYARKEPQYGEVNSVGPDAAGVICGVFRELAKGKK